MDELDHDNELLLQAAVRLLLFVAPIALVVVAIGLKGRSISALAPLIIGAAVALTWFTLRPHPPMRRGSGAPGTTAQQPGTHRGSARMVAMSVALLPLAIV